MLSLSRGEVEDFTIGTFKGEYLGNEEAKYADDKEKICHDIVFSRASNVFIH